MATDYRGRFARDLGCDKRRLYLQAGHTSVSIAFSLGTNHSFGSILIVELVHCFDLSFR